MLTVKKDDSAFKNAFNKKTFYLDSNIIFRLIGLNQQERKQVILAFINRCIEAGITLKYTNVTRQEISITIDQHVNLIKEMLGNKQPISYAAVMAMSSKYANLDFYNMYEEWVQNPLNRAGDYIAFQKYLNYLVDISLRNFKCESFVRKDVMPNKVKYRSLCDDFTEFKRQNFKKTYEGIIQTDIDNLLFLESLNTGTDRSSFVNVNNYIITADHCFVDWSNKQMEHTIPTVVLPSVWYAILLKYLGRTDDDTKAFCQFLTLRLSEGEKFDPRKKMIFSLILELDEPKEIKDEIIFDIDSKLLNKYKEIVDPEEIVAESHKTIIDIHMEKVKEEKDNEYRESIDSKNEEIKRIRHEAQQSSDERHETGKEIGQIEAAVKIGTQKSKRYIKIYWCITIFTAIAAVASIIWIIFNVNKEINEWSKFLIPTILTIVFFVSDVLFYKKVFCELNSAAIRYRCILKQAKLIELSDKAIKDYCDEHRITPESSDK